MSFFASPFQIYKETNKISNKIRTKVAQNKPDSVKNLLVTPVIKTYL